MQHLFLQQSYRDCWEAYQKSLGREHYAKWDYCVLTASNEEQAEVYRMQLAQRQQEGYLPAHTRYEVLTDPEGKRVGSGGATLNVLRFLAEDIGGEDPFAGKRILVIHSGGDSRRVPQYSACGKIFSPVPRELPDGRNSTLFDEFVIGMAGVAGRLKEGMLVLSGDVLLLFNPLQIDLTLEGAAALSVKKPAATGKNHGVFLSDGTGYVKKFLHKQPERTLRACAAVNESGNVDLDTGAVALGTELMRALYGLVCTGRKADGQKFDRFVNERVRLSFYGDFLYPLATDATLEEYEREAAEGTPGEELLACRRRIWEAISGFKMRLLSLTPAEFIHFGTTRELLRLVTADAQEYGFLGWKRLVGTNAAGGGYAAHNSLLEDGSFVGPGAYVENAVIGRGVRVGRGSIVSGAKLTGEKLAIPSGVVLHVLKLKDGRFAGRIFRVSDNPKEAVGRLEGYVAPPGTDETRPLWEIPLYPVCASMTEAVRAALVTYRMLGGIASVEEKRWWLEQEKVSLEESFNRADAGAAFEWERRLAEKIAVRKAVALLENRESWEAAAAVFGDRGISGEQEKQMCEEAEAADFSTAVRIYYALTQECKRRQRPYEQYEEACFGAIRRAVYENGKNQISYRQDIRFAKESAHVKLPVRVNWGGGWTDTPPYCMEQGGTVLNAAVKINGILPVQVTARRLKDYRIEFASEDVGAFGELHSLAEVQDCNNPYDAFALHKAALIACGVVPAREENGKETLQDILERLGGGLFLSTQVVGIPKGSGLGTSSILAGACVRAVYDILGETVEEDILYDTVLCMEQIMSTGGGWQDQVGGLLPGIKFITTAPGLSQHIKAEPVRLAEETQKELQERFALIYTGQRRLARNLLRDVVGSYVGGRPETVDALFRMQRVAALMRFELEKGNLDEFAALLNRHWELSRQLDEGSSNTCIEEIFRACGDLIDGRFIAGAGGGGFLQVILKKQVTKKQLGARLKEAFQGGVDVWDSEFIF